MDKPDQQTDRGEMCESARRKNGRHSVAEAIRSIGVTEVTYYRWRQEYGGLKSDQVKRLKDLEQENARLRKAVVTTHQKLRNRLVEFQGATKRC